MASGSCGTRDKLKQRAARPGNPTCSLGQRSLAKRDRLILVGFIWETWPITVVSIFLQHLDRRRFRKCGENSQTSKQTGIFNDKTAAQQWVKF